MSEPSTPERPEEVRDGAHGDDVAASHEKPTPAETSSSSDAPTPPATPTPAPSEPVPPAPSVVDGAQSDAPAESPPAEPTPTPEAAPEQPATTEATPVEVPVIEDAATTPDAPADAEPAQPDASGGESAAAPVASEVEAAAPDAATPTEAPAADAATAEAATAEAAPAEAAPAEAAPAEAAPAETATADAETPPAEGEEKPDGEAPKAEGEGEKKPKKPKRPKRERKPAAKVHRQTLTVEQKIEAREKARERFTATHQRGGEEVKTALTLLLEGKSAVYLSRFGRAQTGGMDVRALRAVRDDWQDILLDEERRIELREILRSHSALDEKTEQRLQRANTIPAMEDVAAPHLPVVAGRATMARGLGLEPLAEAIRKGEEGIQLADLTQPYVKDGEDATAIDNVLAGARDILAEEMCLDAELRARLRKAFRREARLAVSLRTERKGDAGRHKSLVGFSAISSKVPPLKFLAIRRGEKDRILVTTVEPPEEAILPLLHKSACAEEHPHSGFLRAAIEDGYRRILKPIYQAEIRGELKKRADAVAMDTFERNLRHRLLGPVGGERSVLGLRADVTAGHRWCAIDEKGLPTQAGTLPHEGTAGREACLTELAEILKTFEITALAVGSGAGRAAAFSLAEEAAKAGGDVVDVAVVPDGGTHALEAQGKLEIDGRPVVPPECRGALSLARRFQDPLAELVTIDPKALALGPHLHDVHQGRLKMLLEETVEACTGYVGVDPNKASADLIARVPGFHRPAARAFVQWRDAHGPLAHKAALAAVPGVGTEVADQAVGFLRLPIAEDPRDHTQLHPTQYAVVDKMAEHLGIDVGTLFTDQGVRSKLQLPELESEEISLPLLKYVLFQITAGHLDDRPKFARPIPPPPGLTLDTLQPGLVLEGRVIRAMPFGVFVDVGLDTDALIPTPHIGTHPGIEPATIAPIGAVVQARVLEVIPEKRRLTLSMRPDRAMYDRRPTRGGPRRDGPRGRSDGPRGRGEGGPRGQGARQGGQGARQGGQGGPAGRQGGQGGPGGRQGGQGGQGGRPQRKGPRKGGKFGGTGGVSDIFSGRRHQERGMPRRISLGPDEGKPKEAEKAEEQNLSEEELLARKLADLKKKLEGGG